MCPCQGETLELKNALNAIANPLPVREGSPADDPGLKNGILRDCFVRTTRERIRRRQGLKPRFVLCLGRALIEIDERTGVFEIHAHALHQHFSALDRRVWISLVEAANSLADVRGKPGPMREQ